MRGTEKQKLSDALNIKQSLSEGLRTFLSNILDIILCLNDDELPPCGKVVNDSLP